MAASITWRGVMVALLPLGDVGWPSIELCQDPRPWQKHYF
jgi:hypothetical protein